MTHAFALLGEFAPRLAFLGLWLSRPGRVNGSFGSIIVPVVGVIVLPFTTLTYVLHRPPGGMSRTDWVWMALAAARDLAPMARSALDPGHGRVSTRGAAGSDIRRGRTTT